MTQHTPEIDLALKAIRLKMDKCITGRISYDLFEAQALINAIQEQKETASELLGALKEARQVISVCCGESARYVKIAINNIDAVLDKVGA